MATRKKEKKSTLRRTRETEPRRAPEEFGVRRRSRFLENVSDIDPKNYDLLDKFITEHGKIMPSRFTGSTARQQRQIKRAVRRARVMGLLP